MDNISILIFVSFFYKKYKAPSYNNYRDNNPQEVQSKEIQYKEDSYKDVESIKEATESQNNEDELLDEKLDEKSIEQKIGRTSS